MEKQTFTPGQWQTSLTSEENRIDIIARRPNERQTIANVYGETGHETLYNAHLIAAAPELLENLIEILETFKSCLGGSDPLHYEDFKKEINKAELIINKATK